MQLTINTSDISSHDKVIRLIAEIEKIFIKEGVNYEIEKKVLFSDDPWDSLDIDEIAVDTGIEDFAENHDHYLYGIPKRS